MVNLEWYRTFKAVYKSGTLTGAAEVLFISQPGVSLHLSSLENY
ncbi:MAG: LysR family transcriptional regulator, partial [Flavobacterium sp.]|nr:LysR family transcriptional regulator [Flavobacterium sp.]